MRLVALPGVLLAFAAAQAAVPAATVLKRIDPLPAGATSSEPVRVDALLFLNPKNDAEPTRTGAPRHPDDPLAISLDDPVGLTRAQITVLLEKDSLLATEARQLAATRRYKPLLALSWLQGATTAKDGPAVRVFTSQGDGITGLNGWLRLNVGKFLHLTADIEYIEPEFAVPVGWRLRESRRVEADTVQYYDSPRLGLLVKITPPSKGVALPVSASAAPVR